MADGGTSESHWQNHFKHVYPLQTNPTQTSGATLRKTRGMEQELCRFYKWQQFISVRQMVIHFNLEGGYVLLFVEKPMEPVSR